jgi:hypothetical protein
MTVRTLLGRIRGRLTFANVTASLALFIALGGTGYAAVKLPSNSVGSAQIRTNAVGRSEIRYSGVGMADIGPSQVGRSEIGTGAVGASEIRTDAVGSSEIATGAVGTSELQDGSVDLADLSTASKSAFTPQRAAVTGAGAAAAGNATGVTHTSGSGVYVVTFGRDVSACQAVAAPAVVKTATATDTPTGTRILVAPGAANTQVEVHTFAADGTTAADQPFNVIVAC